MGNRVKSTHDVSLSFFSRVLSFSFFLALVLGVVAAHWSSLFATEGRG